ncbi:aldo/keto reductase [Kitasatospora sp. NPDC088391]|uniref:aldo/keto reductase n=1 Tax=Kitasatospora sp. NPDC088391 TaxID=3364074 RepID=UPI0038288736
MLQRNLGSQGLRVSAQGLGCMGMSQSYGVANDVASLETVHRALDLGLTLLDTANVYGATGLYGVGSNEKLIGHAIRERRDEVVLATKVGIHDVRPDTGMVLRADPDYIRRSADESLARLGVDHIDLYYLHRVDPRTPIEDSVGAMADLVRQGKVRHLGVSEVTADELERAHAVHPITAVQSEYSLWTRGVEESVLPTARRLGISLVPFSPLGRGFLTGTISSTDGFAPEDMRRGMPRFGKEALDANQLIVATIREIADEHGAKPGQVALAWVHAQGEDVVPIPGTKRVAYLEENLAALDLVLTPQDLLRLDTVASRTAGARR